jgi:CBS-domain-containing membrane protein
MAELRVRDLMTENVVSMRAGDSVETIYDSMSERSIRHIAVIDDEGDLVGLVSHRDLLRHALIERPDLPLFVQRALLRRTKVEEIMATSAAARTATAEAWLRGHSPLRTFSQRHRWVEDRSGMPADPDLARLQPHRPRPAGGLPDLHQDLTTAGP